MKTETESVTTSARSEPSDEDLVRDARYHLKHLMALMQRLDKRGVINMVITRDRVGGLYPHNSNAYFHAVRVKRKEF